MIEEVCKNDDRLMLDCRETKPMNKRSAWSQFLGVTVQIFSCLQHDSIEQVDKICEEYLVVRMTVVTGQNRN